MSVMTKKQCALLVVGLIYVLFCHARQYTLSINALTDVSVTVTCEFRHQMLEHV